MQLTGNISEHEPLRVEYIDWLRTITILCVFIFHCARFFDHGDWHVKNSQQWLGADIFVALMSAWIMPMFMVLAGASTYYSLKSRSSWQYVLERTLRLLVPFLFGLLIVTAPQYYYERLYHGSLSSANFWEFYPRYIKALPVWFSALNFYHLWFLIVLFCFSLICLPIISGLHKKRTSLLSRLASKIDNRSKLMLFLVLPLAMVLSLINPDSFLRDRSTGGWCICAHLLFFISGYVIFASSQIIELMRRLMRVVSVGAVAVIVALVMVGTFKWKTYYGSASYAGIETLISFLPWCLMIILTNVAGRYLNFKNRFLAYANDAVLPFYILHQTVIIVVGFYVVKWDLHPAIKYLIIAPVSFCFIVAIYELLIKRITILRFLFGMRIATESAKAEKVASSKGSALRAQDS